MKKIKVFLLFTLLIFISFCFINKSFAETDIIGADNYVEAMDIQSDGKIIVGGSFTSYNDIARKGILRLNSDGSLDKEFNPSIDINSVNDLIVLPGGKILLSVDDSPDNTIENMHGKIVRLNSNGSIDTSFNSREGFSGAITKLNIQSDEKIIVGGFFVGPNDENCIARLNSDGSFDTNFNSTINNGMACFPYFQLDGKIIVSWIDRDSFKNYIIRINSDGSLDESFNYEETEDFSYLPHVQSDGKIILGGTGSMGDGKIIRLNSDGSLDESFNVSLTNKWIETITIQSDGKILIGGFFDLHNDIPQAGIVRLNVDGSLDESFNAEKLIDVYGAIHNLKMHSNDKIIAVLRGGIVHDKSIYPIVSPIIKFNPDGSIDENFGSTINSLINLPIIEIEPTPEIGEIDTILSNDLKGKLLLAVEDHGRVWYVNPSDTKKYEVTFANALNLFERLAVGITNENLNKISLSTDNIINNFGKEHLGKLFLQVEDHGRIWYVNMNGKRHEVTWDNLMDLFTSLSLGITNENLSKIENEAVTIDTDNDGLSDTDEAVYGTDINNPDSDGDGYIDGEEVENGYNPLGSGKLNSNYPNNSYQTLEEATRAISDALNNRDIELFYQSVGEEFWKNQASLKENPEKVREELEEYLDGRDIELFLIGAEKGYDYLDTNFRYVGEIQVFLDGEDVTIDQAGKNNLFFKKENDLWKIVEMEIELPKK